MLYPTTVIPASGEHKATLIWFHGLEQNGEKAAEILAAIRDPHVKYIFPTAPMRKITMAGGAPINSWFDIFGLDGNCPEDTPGVETATKRAHCHIDVELSEGIPASRIFIGGFSMGGAFAMHVAWTYPAKLAGIISLSGYLLLHRVFPGTSDMNVDTPFLLEHGAEDTTVAFAFGEITSQMISQYATNLTFKKIDKLAHEVNPEFASFPRLAGCVIEKNFSTLLTAILCFLHDPKRFRHSKRQLVKETFHKRLCGSRNEADSLEHLAEKATKSSLNVSTFLETWTLLGISREPVDRFISGFVDKSKEWTKKSHRCCGCRNNLGCFTQRMYERLISRVRGHPKVITNFDDDHFAPQSWRCEFKRHLQNYKLLRFSSRNGSSFVNELLQVLSEKVDPADLQFIKDELEAGKTDHSTVDSVERIQYEQKLRGSRELLKMLTRMYYHDFLIFGYPLPIES